MMVLPLPPLALDVLFTFNIALSMLVVMAVVNVVAAAGFRDLPDRAAAGDAAAPGAERRLDARGAAARPPGHRRRGPRHRGLRRVRGRRQLRRRHRRVLDPDHHQLRGRHQGRRPHLGGQRALHPRRDARQADGDRRRPQRRPDHAGRGPRPPRRSAHRGGLLRLDGRRQQVRARRRHRRHPDPAGQHHRRAGHRHDEPRPGLRRRGARVHAADHRRRPGGADPGAAAVDRGGDHRHAHVARPGPGQRS